MKDISDQEVIDHLKRLNRWWPGLGIAPDIAVLEPRAYLSAVKSLVVNTHLRRAVVLMGPRRVGKTVLIAHLVRELLRDGYAAASIGYVEMDHPLLRGRSLESLINLLGSASGNGLRFVFFDEIQYLKDWEQHLKQIVDHRPDLRILVSGSAAAALRRKSNESGAGRFTDFLLPPLTFPEYLKLAVPEPAIVEVDIDLYTVRDIDELNRQFADYINFGGYPELALSGIVRTDPARFVRSDIVDKVLLRDLPQLYGIQDIQELNELFTLLAYNTGDIVSPQGLSQRCGIGKQTIQRYIEYLEAAFLLKRVFQVDQSGRRYQRDRNFKIYLTNPAMRTGLFGAMDPSADGFGHLVETAMYAQRFHEVANLSYARWGAQDNEVDMIECNAALMPVFALEIKWTDQIGAIGESGALAKFVRANKLRDAWISTHRCFEERKLDGYSLKLWPSAVLAFVFGSQAIRGKIAGLNAQVSVTTDGV